MNLLTERLAYVYKERPDLEGEKGQSGLVKASGASKSVVNQWITGSIKSMDIKYALKIESALGFSHIWLMTGDGPPMVEPGSRITIVEASSEDRPRVTLATPNELDLLDLYRRSTPRGKDSILSAAGNAPKTSLAEISARDKMQ